MTEDHTSDSGDTLAGDVPAPEPRVSVVIICFNDEARLLEAIASAQEQSLADIEIIVVDHGSTDASVAVAEAAAERDPRIRVVALPDNDGKPGRPINAGIAAAQAPWVTVFGSDDLLRPRACEHFLRTAEETGADLVVGSLQRINMETGETTRWMPSVSLRNRVVEDLAQFPEVIRDTTGGGKLYNTAFVREHGLSFPEDIYYQDQVFTLEYYATARRVAVLSYFVLDWRHWPSGRPSVTQRRTTVENLSDRFTANERIDEFLTRENRQDLLVLKQRKFLQHDLSIHVKELADATPEYRQMLVERTTAYTDGFQPEALVGLPLNKSLMLNCLRAGRLTEAEQVATVPYNRIASQWSRTTDGSRLFVSPPGQPTGADPVYEVTRYRLPDIPDRFRSTRAEITTAPEPYGFAVTIVIESPDRPVTRFRGRAELALMDTGRGTRRFVSLRRRRSRRPGTVRFTGRVRYQDLDETFGGEPGPITLLGQFHRDAPDQWSITLHPTEPPGQLTAPGSLWRADVDENDTVLHRAPGPLRQTTRRFRTPTTVPPVSAADVFSLSEARQFLADFEGEPEPDRVFFEAFAGRRIGDGPLQVSQALHRRSRKTRQVWSCNGWSLLDVPEYAIATPHFSREYLTELATAKIWIDNGWLPFRPGGRRKLVQLWHGVPFVRLPEQDRRPRWSAVISSGESFQHWLDAPFSEGFTYQPFGAPRTDPLLSAAAGKRRAELRRSWGLEGRTVVLFSPVLRDGEVSAEYRQPDLQRLAADLGDDFFWIHREHDDDATGRRATGIPDDLRWFAATVSGRIDMSDYLLMADILVSDYASVITDFGLTGRPVVHYVPDRTFAEQTSPGTNIRLAEHAAGPVVGDDGELARVLRQGPVVESPAFAARFAPWDAQLSSELLLEWLGF